MLLFTRNNNLEMLNQKLKVLLFVIIHIFHIKLIKLIILNMVKH